MTAATLSALLTIASGVASAESRKAPPAVDAELQAILDESSPRPLTRSLDLDDRATGAKIDPDPDPDRVAAAVEQVESSSGRNPAMWRPEPSGPQGPMQVSQAAALDVGGGNRFDPGENRAIGRLYLDLLYHRYGNWSDAIAAYYWGPGNLDGWIQSGRPDRNRPENVAAYQDRVLRLSGGMATAALATSIGATPIGFGAMPIGSTAAQRLLRDLRETPRLPLLRARTEVPDLRDLLRHDLRPTTEARGNARLHVADADFRRWRHAVSAAFARLASPR